MANLSNINNKFLVTTGGNVLIGQTSAVGSSILQVTGDSTFTGALTGPTATFTGGMSTGYGVSFTNGATDFLLYNNANEDVLYMRDTTNGQMLTIWYDDQFRVQKTFRVDETSALIGNVGIGTDSPDGNLEVITSAVVSGVSDTVNNVLIGLQSANRPTIILDTADTTYTNRTWNITNVGSAGKLFIGRNGLDVMVMDNNGNVGIGTDSPGAKLDIKSSLTAIGTEQLLTIGHDINWNLKLQENWNASGIQFDILQKYGTGAAANVLTFFNGNVGIGTTSPSDKLTIEDSGSVVMSIYSTDTGSWSVPKTFINLYGEDTAGTKRLQAQIASAPGHNASSAGELQFFTGDSSAVSQQRMTIREDGNVGIGTGTGAINAKLDVRNDDGLASGLHIVADFNRAAGTDAQMILGYYANGSSVDGPCVYSANGKPLILAPGTEKLRIQNSSQSLRIKGGSVTGSNYMQFVNSAETSQGYFGYGGGSNILYIVQQVDGDIQFYSNGATRMTINTAGDVGIGVAPEGNIVSYIKQLRIGEQTTIQGHADGVGVGSASWFSTNYIFSVGGATTITAGESMVYQAQSGRHSFHNSESTAAGAVPVLRDGFSIEPNLDLKASTKGPQTQGVGVVYAAPYPLRFNTFNGTGPKFLGVYPLRGGSQFLDIAINTTSDGIMYYAMFRGYFYGRGSRWSWTGGYTYQGSIINIQNHFVLNGNTADLTAYRGAAGSAYPLNLCFRMDSGSSGYTEGFGELYIFAHVPTLQDAFQVTAFAENNAANPGLWT